MNIAIILEPSMLSDTITAMLHIILSDMYVYKENTETQSGFYFRICLSFREREICGCISLHPEGVCSPLSSIVPITNDERKRMSVSIVIHKASI